MPDNRSFYSVPKGSKKPGGLSLWPKLAAVELTEQSINLSPGQFTAVPIIPGHSAGPIDQPDVARSGRGDGDEVLGEVDGWGA